MADSLAPPPKSGNGAFIAVAVIMLLAAGGLIFWKLSGDEEKEEKPVAAAPKPKPKPKKIDFAPPPPPVEEEDAGADAETKKTAAVKGPSGPNPCAVKECKGKAGAQLRSALAAKAGASRRCYERALQSNEGLQGRIVISVRVGPQGQVCSAGVASDSVGGGVANCALNSFRAGRLPPPSGGCVDTAVPISFKPKGT